MAKDQPKQTNPLEEVTTVSELIDRLTIENVRLWMLREEIKVLKNELDTNVTQQRKQEIKKILANKTNAEEEIANKCSLVKNAIDEMLSIIIRKVIKGQAVTVISEHKAYGK